MARLKISPGVGIFLARIGSEKKNSKVRARNLAIFADAQANPLPAPSSRLPAGFLSMFFECFKDPILIVLLVAACISLIVNTISHPTEGFIDGLAILLAVTLVALVTATNNYKKQLQFRALQVRI
jgi:magnesium-transporting ATPase (P-type)